MLSVIAAASAPLLIIVGCGRVRRGESSSPTGTPETFVGGGGNTESVVVTGCVGRAILLEKICEDVEVGETGEVEEARDDVDIDLVEVTTVVVAGSVG